MKNAAVLTPALDATFSISLRDGLAVAGIAQCIFVLVYILFRVRSWRQTSITIFYFAVLCFSFILQFAEARLDDYALQIRLGQWVCWLLSPPLCYLMVLQVAKDAPPKARNFLILLLVPAVAAAAFMLRTYAWIYWLAAISGAVCMLLLWAHKDLLGVLWRLREGRDKYWLILSLVLANLGVVAVNLLRSTGHMEDEVADSLLTVIGLGFVYLAMTTMFRVYRPPVVLREGPRVKVEDLSTEEQKLAQRVRDLMQLDKLYHEPTFSRADLARELNVSENTVSRVINASFGKSFPQLLGEFRVEDAKRMLKNSDIPVQVIAAEVGFNSLASFNRVFREVTGISPTGFRNRGSEEV